MSFSVRQRCVAVQMDLRDSVCQCFRQMPNKQRHLDNILSCSDIKLPRILHGSVISLAENKICSMDFSRPFDVC